MNNYKNVFELIDISSSEDEEELLERASTRLPREFIPNYRVVLEVSRSSAEAVADGEEYFDISSDSLERNCKKMRLISSLESLEPETYAPRQEFAASRDEELPDSPESPNENVCSDVFIVEAPTIDEESITSSKVAKYHERVQQEDSDSHFITPPAQ